MARPSVLAPQLSETANFLRGRRTLAGVPKTRNRTAPQIDTSMSVLRIQQQICAPGVDRQMERGIFGCSQVPHGVVHRIGTGERRPPAPPDFPKRDGGLVRH